jgi:hypothetical protein
MTDQADPAAFPPAASEKDSWKVRLTWPVQVGLLFLLIVVHRTWIVARTTTIASDGGFYLQAARDLYGGNIQFAFADSHFHPLHFILTTTLADLLGGNLELGAYVLAIAAASLTILPLCFIVRWLWNEHVSAWTGLLYALHPTLSYEGSQVLNTSLYLCLFVTSVALLSMALRGDNWLLYPLAGLSAALCYLTRPEGIVLVGIATVAVAIVVVKGNREGSGVQLRLAGGIALAMIVYAAFAMPYLVWLHRTQGAWCLTARGAGRKLIQPFQDPNKTPSATVAAVPKVEPEKLPPPRIEPVPPANLPASPPPSKSKESGKSEKRPFFHSAQLKLRAAVFPPLFPLLVVGLIACRRYEGKWIRLFPIWGTALLCFSPALIFLATVPRFHLSERYLLTGTLFLLPWIAVGLLAVSDGISRILTKLPSSRPLKWIRWIPQAAFAAVFLFRAAGPHRAEEFTFLEAGAWLQKNGPATPRYVLSNSDKIAYYGGYRPYALPQEADATIPEQVRRTIETYRTTNAAFLILHEGSHRHRTEFPAELERAGFQLVKMVDKGSRKEGVPVRIYQLKPLP